MPVNLPVNAFKTDNKSLAFETEPYDHAKSMNANNFNSLLLTSVSRAAPAPYKHSPVDNRAGTWTKMQEVELECVSPDCRGDPNHRYFCETTRHFEMVLNITP